MSKQLTAEEILEQLTPKVGEEYLKLHTGKKEFKSANAHMKFYENQALAQLHQALKERMPEKIFDWEKGRIYTDEERHKYYRMGHNQALDKVNEILNDFFKGGK